MKKSIATLEKENKKLLKDNSILIDANESFNKSKLEDNKKIELLNKRISEQSIRIEELMNKSATLEQKPLSENDIMDAIMGLENAYAAELISIASTNLAGRLKEVISTMKNDLGVEERTLESLEINLKAIADKKVFNR